MLLSVLFCVAAIAAVIIAAATVDDRMYRLPLEFFPPYFVGKKGRKKNDNTAWCQSTSTTTIFTYNIVDLPVFLQSVFAFRIGFYFIPWFEVKKAFAINLQKKQQLIDGQRNVLCVWFNVLFSLINHMARLT